MNKTSKLLGAARYRASRRWPYLSTALWAMHPVPSPDLPFPMAVDKYWRLYFRPDLLEQWDVNLSVGVLYHEVHHLLRDHAARAETLNAQPMAWNLATDAEINDDLEAERVALPEGVITPQGLGQEEGQLAEVYYRNLEQTKEAPPERADGPGPGTASRDAEDPGEPHRSCGSCAHGHPEPWEDKAPGGQDNKGRPGISPARAKLIRRKTAEAITEHVRSRGTVPGQWERWAETLITPKVHWTKELAASIRASLGDVAGQVDYTYRRISRRQSVFPRIVQPALRSPTPKLAVVIDTSGSMSTDMLTQALTECKGVLQAAGMNYVPVLPCDAQVHSVQKIFNPRQIQLQGGGGTDMGEGIEAAKNLKPKPDVVIFFTDMLTPWPDEPPPFKLICGAFGDDHGWDPPAYGKVIKIPVTDDEE